MKGRAFEIENWILNNAANEKYVIIDDDPSLHTLTADIKHRCVITNPYKGLDEEAMILVLDILNDD